MARIAILASLLAVSASCSNQSPSSSNSALGPVATHLPKASASLKLSGAVGGNVSEVRVLHRGRTAAGATTLFSSEIYVQIGKYSYDFYTDGQEMLNAVGFPTGSGYIGSGLYLGNAFLREMDLYPAGLVSTGRQWAPPDPEGATISLGSPQGPVTVGSKTPLNPPFSLTKPANLSKDLALWPTMPGSAGVAPNSTPSAQDLTISGWWRCH